MLELCQKSEHYARTMQKISTLYQNNAKNQNIMPELVPDLNSDGVRQPRKPGKARSKTNRCTPCAWRFIKSKTNRCVRPVPGVQTLHYMQ
uniref:Uncharacterized protein n=1 Tax=Romanomermis culicivorax TaxID=13658 RepID=A0A915L2F1_ROMCU